jgi:hypothetical protein
MKIENYYLCKPVKGLFKSDAIMIQENNVSMPVVYLTRPGWIKDDAAWHLIVASVGISLPLGFEVN